jgi:carbonic anhydrase/acetyltransferase-like protein (isoleucine patch superfamily)
VPCFQFEDRAPVVHPDAFIAPTATLVGDVHVGAGASIWFGAVLRADVAPIIVRDGATVQDAAVVYASPGLTVDIGPGATIGTGAVVRGAVLEAGAVVGTGAVVLDAATLGAGSLTAAGSVVAARTQVPAGYLATGSPAVARRPVVGSPAEVLVATSAVDAAELADRHRAGLSANP